MLLQEQDSTDVHCSRKSKLIHAEQPRLPQSRNPEGCSGSCHCLGLGGNTTSMYTVAENSQPLRGCLLDPRPAASLA